MVTDRDLAIRVLAEGRGPDTPVREAMTPDPVTCSPDDDVDKVERLMAERQVRRIPVVENGRVVGVVAQADLALHPNAVSDREVGHLVEEISQPTR